MHRYIAVKKMPKYSIYAHAVHFPKTGRVWGVKAGVTFRELLIMGIFAYEQIFNPPKKIIGNKFAI